MPKPVKIAFEGDESDLVRSLDKAGAGLDDFAADAKASGDKAEAALGGVGDKADAVGSASSQAAGGIGDLGGALALMPGPLGAVGAGMEAAAPAIMGVTGAADLLNLATTKFPALAKAQALATKAVAASQAALNAVMALNPIALVVLAIVALIAIFVILYQKNEGFRTLVDAVFSKFKEVVQSGKEKFGDFAESAKEKIGVVLGKFADFRERVGEVVGVVKDKLQNAGERFGDLRDAVANAIGTYSAGGGGALGKVHNIVEAVTSLPGAIREKAAGIFGPVRDAADNAVGTYSAEGGGALGKLHNVVSTVTGLGATIRTKAAGMFDGIKEAFASAINYVIRGWNNLSFSVDIPDDIPGLPDSYTIATPNIPELASGGVVTRATLAIIGEAGPEAVIPLDRLAQFGGGTTRVVVELSAEQLSDLMLGRRIVGAVDAYTGAGGRRAA